MNESGLDRVEKRKLGHAAFIVRVQAFLWDYLLIAAYLVLLVGVFYAAKPLLLPLFTRSPVSAEISGFLLLTLPVYLYFAISEGAKFSGTWGKRKMRIKVVDMQGQPLGPGASFFRSALKFLPWELAHFTIWHMTMPSGYSDDVIIALLATVYGLVLAYVLSPLLSATRRTLYDRIAGTEVRYRD